MIAHTPEERMKYEARRKAELDFNSFVAEAQRKGLAGQVRLCQLYLREPVTAEADLLAMDFEPLSQLCDQLKARVPLPK